MPSFCITEDEGGSGEESGAEGWLEGEVSMDFRFAAPDTKFLA